MPDYTYDQTLAQYTSQSVELKPIKLKSTVRHKIEHLQFNKNMFHAISSIQQNYLGVIQA